MQQCACVVTLRTWWRAGTVSPETPQATQMLTVTSMIRLMNRESLQNVWQMHRRRIFTEEEAEVVVASWGTEFIQFLAALAILHQNELNS